MFSDPSYTIQAFFAVKNKQATKAWFIFVIIVFIIAISCTHAYLLH